MVKLIDHWMKEIGLGKLIGALCLDLRKAFNLVDYDILLRKSQLYHFYSKIVQIIYFKQKTKTRHGKSYSDILPVISGAAQGSVIDPLLFRK